MMQKLLSGEAVFRETMSPEEKIGMSESSIREREYFLAVQNMLIAMHEESSGR